MKEDSAYEVHSSQNSSNNFAALAGLEEDAVDLAKGEPQISTGNQTKNLEGEEVNASEVNASNDRQYYREPVSEEDSLDSQMPLGMIINSNTKPGGILPIQLKPDLKHPKLRSPESIPEVSHHHTRFEAVERPLKDSNIIDTRVGNSAPTISTMDQIQIYPQVRPQDLIITEDLTINQTIFEDPRLTSKDISQVRQYSRGASRGRPRSRGNKLSK